MSANPILYFTDLGSGPPLLLIHGLMVTGEMFEPIVGPLAEHHRLIIPDLRGHGRSRGLGPPYHVARLAADLSRLLDHLDIPLADVLGYSQGGAVAQQFALDYPDQCRRLVLACTYAYNMASLREQVEGRLVPALIALLGMRRFAELVIGQGLKQVSRRRAEWVMGLIATQDRTLMQAAWRETVAFDSRARLADIRCPTLVIAAAQDEAVPAHHAHMLRDGIKESQLVVIDPGDHALIWARPEALLEAVEPFLAH